MADSSQPPRLPYQAIHEHLGDDPRAKGALDALHAALDDPQAERSHVERHVGILRTIPGLTATIEAWYDSPSVQSWLKTLSDLGF
jgi:hypothetical protein